MHRRLDTLRGLEPRRIAIAARLTAFVDAFRPFPQLLRLVWAAHPAYAAASLVLTLVSALASPAQIWISKLLIDGVVESVRLYGASQDLDWPALLSPVGLMLAVAVFGTASQSLATHVRMLLSISSDHHARHLILEKAASMDLAFYESPVFFDRLENAESQTHRAHNITFAVFDTLRSLTTLAGLLILLATSLHWAAVPVLLIATFPEAVALGYFVRRRHLVWGERTRLRRIARYLAQLLTSRDAAKEIRLFGLALPFASRHGEACRVFMEDERQYRYSVVRTETGFRLISLLGSGLLWSYAVIRAIWGSITIGDVAVVLQAAERAREAVAMTFDRFVRLYENRLYAAELTSFLDLSPRSVEGALAAPVANPRPVPRPIAGSIEFRDVRFVYPNAEVPVLDGFSCTLTAGSSVALVGQNGAGKTTLVKLLSRLYDPTEGSILVDGIDLREYDRDDWRDQVGVVLQDFMRYDLTARENIGFGRVEYVDDVARVSRAADSAGAAHIVGDLPDGYETVLGRTFDNGKDLSGGQWQTLALARGYMRDAQILILDEPTAALDAFAEFEVYQRFTDLTEGRTTVLISHRFSTVRMADHILVLDGGRLAEQGSHDELVAADGMYARMFATQAQRYE